MKVNVFGKFKFRLSKYLFILFTTLLLIAVVVIVKPPVEKFSVPVEIFKSNNYQDFEKYTRKIGAKKSYQALKSYFKANETAAHDFAHVVGFVAVEEADINGIKVCDNFYNYGCYHGFMQIYLQKHGVSSVVDMEKSCLSLGQVSSPSCLHGIGHGLMMEAAYDYKQALKNCQILAISSQTYCFDGVFMERIAGSMLPDAKKLKITKDNIMEPCNKIDRLFAKECWRNQVAAWFRFFGNNTGQVGSYCASIDAIYQDICFETIGLTNIMNLGEDQNKLVSACQIVSAKGHDACLVGEVKELLFEGRGVEVAANLCNFVTAQTRNSCQETFKRMYEEYRQRFVK